MGSESLLSQVTRALEQALTSDSPETDDELHAYIKDTFGFHIPRKAICEGHCAPFDFVADLYFERVDSALALANRSGGKTLDVATLNVLDAAFKGASVANVAGSKQQAKRCYDYSKKFWYRDRQLEVKLEKPPLMSETRLLNGATYEILAGSATSVRSPHVPKLRMDEIEEMKEEVFTGALSIPISQEGVSSQVSMTSTRHKAHGKMQLMLDEADERGFTVYKWCVFETMAPCREDCKTCPIQPDCGGRARESDGYRSYADTLQQFRLHDRDTWVSEWLCKKPAKHLRVYYDFDADIHVVSEAPEELELWGCIDWGYENPFVFVKFGVAPNDDKYAIESQYRNHRTDADLADEMRSLYPEIRDVCADPSNPGGIEEFKRRGFKVHSRSSEVAQGIKLVRKDLKPPEGRPKLYFVRGATRNLINEFESYENKPGTDDPKKEFDHGPDAIRYWYAVNRMKRLATGKTLRQKGSRY